MREDYTLLTPENVELRFDVAGVGSRLVAGFIDYALLAFCYLIFTFGGAFVRGVLGEVFPRALNASEWAPILGYATVAFFTLLAFFGWWGYWVLFEVLWNGQTPGKRLLGLRVVGANGQPIGGVASLVRNLLRAIDQPLLIGVVVMLVDGSSRRLGDMAAGSLVVREPRGLARSVLAPVVIPEVSAEQVSGLANAERLTMAHYTLMRDFFARRDRLTGRAADDLARRLALDLARVLDVSPAELGEPGRFIATAARAFEARHAYYDGGSMMAAREAPPRSGATPD